ncbi:hypothetical protein [Heyndrickxia camelliae]|uniref:Uncharacterized protein n=1 Tax=Heyndrickxia camelliae TaxID=1707093 RepID=A0A2N3LFE2_9BACI|nr:hypothetical protein [Heyndrickxia camelliae]PKR83243.1 hypothetical protein CWO92_19765 [Heyndrickxia camelliae]
MNENKMIHIQATQKQIEKAILGGIKSTIIAHGDINKQLIDSTVKRIYGHMKQHMKINFSQ